VRVAFRSLELGRVWGLICGLHAVLEERRAVLEERRAAHGRREQSSSAHHWVIRDMVLFAEERM
jgi:hypothetical protein